jgi:osmoprotectant transport system ATP-binding protein
MTQASPAIAFEAVSKTLGDGPPALEAVSFAVPTGQFLAVIGVSGSGKTTLLRLINRLTDPTTGTVHVEGEDVRATDPIALRRRIGYVFQGIGLFPHMTVEENIGITPRLIGWDKPRIAARLQELLDLVQLRDGHQRRRFPRELSGGQQQRVGVARALAAEPKIMLMDEPFGALDPVTRDTLAQDYRRLHDALGLTTVMVTHDTLEAVLIADRILVLEAGRIVADGTPQTLMAFDESAYVRDLMQTPRRQAERLQALVDRRAAR